MKAIHVLIVIMLSVCSSLKAQTIVKALQPSIYSFLMAGHQLSDTTARYFFTSKESKYGPNERTIMVDLDVKSHEILIASAVDTIQGAINAAEELFHIPIENGDAIIGSNGFQCDILITSLSYISKDGRILWLMENVTWSPEDLIDKIGFVASTVIAVVGRDWLTHYYDFSGNELFYEVPPHVYFNIIAHNGFYFGTRNEAVYKLNNHFEQIESYWMPQPQFLNKIDGNKFIASSSSKTVILDQNLDEIAITTELTNAYSASATAESVWLLNADGLYQFDMQLKLYNHYLPEPHERMGHVWAYRDTVYVGSEFNGINHTDFVIRMYTNGLIAANSFDVTLASIYVDTVIRDIVYESWQRLTFDSVSIGIHNHGLDTIKSVLINWDWKINSGSCSGITGEKRLDSISIPPSQTRLFSFEMAVIHHALSYIDPEFCFWIDYVNEHTDINPEDNMNCFEGTITKTNEIQVDHGLSLMPNPANELITVESKAGRLIDHLSFYSNTGMLVYSTLFSGGKVEVNIQDWPSGVYYLQAMSGDQHEYRMFIKQ